MRLAALMKANAKPTDADIRSALGANICRCTGYTQDSCRGERNRGRMVHHRPATGWEFGVSGEGTHMGPNNTHANASAEGGVVGVGGQGKIDGTAKITGAAIFTDDIRLPRMAHAKLVRSTHPHARILTVDTERPWPCRAYWPS